MTPFGPPNDPQMTPFGPLLDPFWGVLGGFIGGFSLESMGTP